MRNNSAQLALVTRQLRELGFAPENTLHDIRWGQHYRGNGVNDYVWVLLISGAVPPASKRPTTSSVVTST